jgi:3-phenylpropionate/cinnamic acid dioxygenase small subunit
MTADSGRRLSVAEQHAVEQFLYDEAAILDDHRYRDWLAILSPQIRYVMPVRISVVRGRPDERADLGHFDEDLYGLTKRVERLETEQAWTEEPPSRPRRFVSNVRGFWREDGDLTVHSYLLLFRSRGDQRPPEWLSAGRRDRLRPADAEFVLMERRISVDESVLRTQNLALFI